MLRTLNIYYKHIKYKTKAEIKTKAQLTKRNRFHFRKITEIHSTDKRNEAYLFTKNKRISSGTEIPKGTFCASFSPKSFPIPSLPEKSKFTRFPSFFMFTRPEIQTK